MRRHGQAALRVEPRGSLDRRAAAVRVEIEYHREAFESACEYGQMLLDTARRAGDRQCELRALYNLGRAFRRRGLHLDALAWLAEAKVMAEAEGNGFYEGLCWYNIGYSQEMLGQTKPARESYECALALLGT